MSQNRRISAEMVSLASRVLGEQLDKEMQHNVSSKLAASANGVVWAQDFMKLLKDHPDIEIDEDLMVGWFSAAIMAGWDEARRRRRAAAKLL